MTLKDIKTKSMRQALGALKADKTALLVEAGNHENLNLELSSRNLAGVEMLYGPEVHAYHLLRYDRAIFSRPALERAAELAEGFVAQAGSKAEVA